MANTTVTAESVEKLVIDNGCPETLVVPNDDFAKIYAVYRNINRDDKGAFVLALNTKIRPKTVSDDKIVDLGNTVASVFGVK